MDVPVFEARAIGEQKVLVHDQFKNEKFFQLVSDAVIDDGSKNGLEVEVYEFILESLDIPKTGMIKNIEDKNLTIDKEIRKLKIVNGKEQIVSLPVTEPYIHCIKDFNLVTYKEVRHVIDGLDITPINLDFAGARRHVYVDSALIEDESDVVEVEIEDEKPKSKRKTSKSKSA